MALNKDMTWTDVGNISTGSGLVRDAFQLMYGAPTKELLPAGMLIYKFNGYSTIAQGELTPATDMSPWWSATLPYKHDAGLKQRKLIAQKNGVTFREWGRLTSVIKEDWSSMAWLLKVELKEPVYAWFGGFKGMSRSDNPSKSKMDVAKEAKGSAKNLPGGGTQFYIPNLTFAHIRKHSFEPM